MRESCLEEGDCGSLPWCEQLTSGELTADDLSCSGSMGGEIGGTALRVTATSTSVVAALTESAEAPSALAGVAASPPPLAGCASTERPGGTGSWAGCVSMPLTLASQRIIPNCCRVGGEAGDTGFAR